ncbi:PxKF domain-containing protein [Microbacterium sp. LWH7-1.2]|jgi:regulation of enolase protein 1 (concanavalin A-like superfamily)|uniref:OmpL47-type beta-barrel domain-containing protein n=1 Tax=Microbacterium sp. LWH7-1.2 TaxID=3135257 RepID=UPI003138D3A1
MVQRTTRRSRASAVTLAFALAILPVCLGAEAANADELTTLYVAPEGTGTVCAADNACSVEEAKRQVRGLAPDMSGDITVVLAAGTYRLADPLHFGAEDSGTNGHTVSWVAAPDATPVLSGGARIDGWTPAAGSTTIWQAPVPAEVEIDPGQLYVDGVMATRARTQLSRGDISITASGIDLTSPALSYLNSIQQQDRVTMEFVNSFTDRYSPVESIANNHLTMAQPAWDNNTWGWDTIQRPFRTAPVYIENAREFLDEPGEWYFDADARTVYYQPLQGQSMNGIDVEMPRLESLLQISGTYDAPAHNLTFSGIEFSDTAWTAPDSDQGYAVQQSGAFAYGTSERPADAFTSCGRGCRLFEATRNSWHMTPAAVQVSAANNITLTDNVYTNLGAVSLGIGLDANANASGVGLGASDVTVSRSRFFESAGGAIVVGGIQPDAHHPSDPRMTNEDITISDNLVHDVAKVYEDQTGILFTYVTRATVTHNEVRGVPYTGMGAGWGWGTNDVGGNAEYVTRGLYDFQPMYDTPTTFRDALVSHNFIHDVMQTMHDGAAFYNLSKSPGSVLEENYLLSPNTIGTYFDEGSGLWTSQRNIYHVRTPGNTWNAGAGNITYKDNWLVGSNASSFSGPTNTVSGTVLLGVDQVLPLDAARVAYDSGLSQALRTALDPLRPAMSVSLTAATAGQANGPGTVEVGMTNLDTTAPLHTVSAALSAPAGWTVTAVGTTPTTIDPGGTVTARFTVTPPQGTGKLIATASVWSSVTYSLRGQTGSAVSAPTTLTAPVAPVTSLRTFGSVPSVFAEKDGLYSIGNAGADVWSGGSQSDDEYGTIFSPDGFHDGSVMTVRVDSEDAVNAWTKAGLVVRDDLTKPRQSLGYLALVVTPSNGITYNYDSNRDGLLDASYQVRNVKAPVWLRLTRTGAAVSAAYSSNGTAWTAVGSPVTLVAPQATQDAGMIFTSHDRNKFGTAVFSGFTGVPPVDTVAPVVSASTTPATAGGQNGWFVSPVSVSVSASDEGSGVASVEYRLGEGAWSGYSSPVSIPEGATTFSYRATDEAGNVSEVTQLPVKVDGVAPVTSAVVSPGSGVVLAGSTVSATFAASDETSGVAGTEYSTDGGATWVAATAAGVSFTEVGAHVVTYRSVDAAGNVEAAKKVTLTVVQPRTFTGFYAPVDMAGVVNVVKSGSTVPLKFELFFGEEELTSTTAIESLRTVQHSCDPAAPTDEVETVVTGGTSLVYDEEAGQFQYNWKTSKGTTGCVDVIVRSTDGVELKAQFRLK